MSDVVQVVFKKGVLFDITIGRWSAKHSISMEDLMLEKVNRKVIKAGSKELLPEDYAYPLVHIEGKIRTFVKMRSMPFPISGAVFVNFKALPKMLKGLRALKEEYDAAALNLYNHYDDVMSKQIDILDEEVLKIAVQNGFYEPSTSAADKDAMKQWLKEAHQKHVSLYPKKDDLLAKYYVSWAMFKVNALEDTAATMLSEEEAEFFAEQQKELKDKLTGWVKEKAAAMHKKLGEAAANAQKLLADNGKLNPKNLKPLFDAFEEFTSVDFAGSSFQTVIGDIEKKYLGGDMKAVAEKVNSGTDEFSSLLATISDLAMDQVAQKAGFLALDGSEFKRVVEI
jgi:gas vesicle protein